MPKLTDTQTLILNRAATRSCNLAMPLPEGLHGAAAKKVVGLLIERGWLEEVDADLRRNEPLWRETGHGQGTTLIATETGLEAIGIEPVVANAVTRARKAKPAANGNSASPEPTASPKPVSIRPGTKQALIITLMQRPEGETIAEIVAATGWEAHTVRGGDFRGAEEEAGSARYLGNGRGQGADLPNWIGEPDRFGAHVEPM